MSPPSLPPLAAARPLFAEDDMPRILEDIAAVLRSGRLILGPKTRELEAAWSARTGTKHAVALSSCTAALQIAYLHAGARGREIVVPTNTFVATANAALFAGAKVVFADMSTDDFGIDAEDALAKIGPETAAVVVVHIAGLVAKATERLRAECKSRKILLVEDCAHAHGAKLGDRGVGSLGDVGCFSLYPTKILTSGVGGVLTTDDDALAEFARSMRHHGQGPSLEEIVNSGNDWVMDEVRAVLACQQLRRLDDLVGARRAVAARYDELLRGDPDVTTPVPQPGTFATYYKYPVVLRRGIDRDRLRARLHDEHGIEAGALYSPPCHLMPVFRNLLGTGPGTLPKAEDVLPRQICLPMHAAMSPADADRSVGALRAVLRSAA